MKTDSRGLRLHGFSETVVLDFAETDCEVSGPLALTLRASCLAGAAPLRVTRAGNKWLITSSSGLAILQRLFMAACNLTMLAGLGWDFTQEPSKRIFVGETTVETVIWVSDLFLVMLVANLTVHMGSSRMKSLIHVHKQLQQINFELEIKPQSAKSETMRSIAIICMLIWSTGIQIADAYFFIQAAVTTKKMWPIMCMYCTYYYSNIIGVLMVLHWNCAARGAHAAAAALNRQLHQLRHDVSMDSSQVEATIRRLALSYGGVSEIVTQLNDCFGTVLHAMITSICLRLVLTPYYYQMELNTTNNQAIVVSSVMLNVNWSLFHIINLMVIVEPSHWTHEERETTGQLLSLLTVYLAPKCDQLPWALDKFAKQVTLDNAKFTPLGIYTLARPLMATILGGVSTYLVIIMEFQKSS